ncbi:MAG: ABC transporter permease [Nitratireductor sp.]
MNNRRNRLAAFLSGPLPGLATLCAFMLVWQLVELVFDPPKFLLPSPREVLLALTGSAGYLARNSLVTFTEMVLGLLVGSWAGAALALLVARYPRIGRFVMPMIITTQTLPVFAIAPLLVIWFGFGAGSKVVMASLIIFFPVASSFHDGLRRTEPEFVDLARGWGASPWQMLTMIRFPAALPSLASGLRIAAVLAPIGAVVGEWAGAASGLGYVMLQANARGQTELVFAAVIILALAALLLRFAVSISCDRIVFWQVPSTISST